MSENDRSTGEFLEFFVAETSLDAEREEGPTVEGLLPNLWSDEDEELFAPWLRLDEDAESLIALLEQSDDVERFIVLLEQGEEEFNELCRNLESEL